MQRIRSLYATFSNTEKRYLNAWLETFHSRGENYPLALIRLIGKNPGITKSEASEKLYGDPKSKAFSMMKSRLYDKMMDVLMSSINLSNLAENRFSDLETSRLILKKQEIQAIILNSRGLKDQLEDLAKRSEKLAFEYDLPVDRIEALSWLRQLQSQVHSDQVEGTRKTIESSIEIFRGDMAGLNFMDEFRMKFAGSSRVEATREYLEKAIPELARIGKESGSPVASYSLLLFQVHYYNLLRDYRQCREAIDGLLALNARHKRYNTDWSYGQSYMHLGMLEMVHHHLPEAAAAIEKALSRFVTGNRNRPITLVVFVFVLIHQGKLKPALQRILEIRQDSYVEPMSFNWAMSYYQEACIAFIERDFSKTWKLLNRVTGLEFDKSGWMNGVRIFEIMTLIELNESDLAATRLESLRKHQKKYSPDNRSKKIFEVLNAMQKVMFNFRKLEAETLLVNDLLADREWKIAGHETIRFDKWFCHHLDKEKTNWESLFQPEPG